MLCGKVKDTFFDIDFHLFSQTIVILIILCSVLRYSCMFVIIIHVFMRLYAATPVLIYIGLSGSCLLVICCVCVAV